MDPGDVLRAENDNEIKNTYLLLSHKIDQTKSQNSQDHHESKEKNIIKEYIKQFYVAIFMAKRFRGV